MTLRENIERYGFEIEEDFIAYILRTESWLSKGEAKKKGCTRCPFAKTERVPYTRNGKVLYDRWYRCQRPFGACIKVLALESKDGNTL